MAGRYTTAAARSLARGVFLGGCALRVAHGKTVLEGRPEGEYWGYPGWGQVSWRGLIELKSERALHLNLCQCGDDQNEVTPSRISSSP